MQDAVSNIARLSRVPRRAHLDRICLLRSSHHFNLPGKVTANSEASTRRCLAGSRRGIDRLSSCALEQKLERELRHATVTCAGKCTFVAIGYVVARVAKVRMVEEVEELAPELDFPKLVDREFLKQREVHVDPARTIQRTS